MVKFNVDAFGRDCMGNVSGYRVYAYVNGKLCVYFNRVANLYEPGSQAAAYAACIAEANRLSADARAAARGAV